MSAAVSIKNLEFEYRKGTPLLSIKSFELDAGRHCFIEGHSGSGKSTFMGLLCGLIQPDRGEIWIQDQNIVTMNSMQRDRFRGVLIGYLAQLFNLIPYLSARENICLPLSLHRIAFGDAIKLRLDNLAERLNIKSIIERPVRELSVGQQQRVAAARAFILDPALVIADEPTSSLDDIQKNNLMQCLIDMAQNRKVSLLVASHDVELRKYFSMSFNPGKNLCS